MYAFSLSFLAFCLSTNYLIVVQTLSITFKLQLNSDVIATVLITELKYHQEQLGLSSCLLVQ